MIEVILSQELSGTMGLLFSVPGLLWSMYEFPEPSMSVDLVGTFGDPARQQRWKLEEFKCTVYVMEKK